MPENQFIIPPQKSNNVIYFICFVAILVMIALVAYLFNAAVTNLHHYDSEKHITDSLNKRILIFQDSINVSENKVSYLLKRIDTLEHMKATNDSSINQIKHIYDKKISSVDSYTDSSIIRFFTDRYK